jgi:hypothetical protein
MRLQRKTFNQKTTTTMYKFITFAYPTSTHAVKFGFPNEGCYVVMKWNQLNPGKAIKAFATQEEAVLFANTIDIPKCNILTKYYA